MSKPLLIPPLWFALFAALAWGIARSWPGPALVFPGRDVMAEALGVLGLGIAAAALVQFQRRGTTYKPEHPDAASALVTGGVYRISRNPMYLGMALILVALALALGSAAALLATPAFMAVVTFAQILPEERALSDKFGDAYRAYRARTGRWIII